MIDKYQKIIASSNDPADIAAVLLMDSDFRKDLEKYGHHPYDVEFFTVDGNFNLAVSKADALIKSIKDPATALTVATIEARTKLACSGARYITTDFSKEPAIKMLGFLKEENARTKMGFSTKGETIYLVSDRKKNDPAEESLPEENHDNGENATIAIEKSVSKGLVATAHAIKAANGVFAALIESSRPNMLGFDITTDSEMDEKDFLFGQNGYIAIITVNESQENEFVDYMFNRNVEIMLLGHVTKGEIRIDDQSYGFVSELL